jgi:hypothetical protein
MPDQIDMAQEEIARMQQASLDAARSSRATLKPSGRCHNCDEPLSLQDLLFCDADCAEDYERRLRAERMRVK